MHDEGDEMSAFARVVRFGLGGVLGAAVGGGAAFLFAPQSGDELGGKVRRRLADARLAGAEAEAAKEQELIARFRQAVNDAGALRADEVAAQAAVADASRSEAAVR